MNGPRISLIPPLRVFQIFDIIWEADRREADPWTFGECPKHW